MGRTIRWVQTCIRLLQWGFYDRSHVEASNRPRGNASMDALRPLLERGASRAAFLRGSVGMINLPDQFRRLRVSEGSSPNCLR
jgi:hypothetical protein